MLQVHLHHNFNFRIKLRPSYKFIIDLYQSNILTFSSIPKILVNLRPWQERGLAEKGRVLDPYDPLVVRLVLVFGESEATLEGAGVAARVFEWGGPEIR